MELPNLINYICVDNVIGAVAPVGPATPGKPCGPVAPVGPATPGKPCGPVAPVGPVTPGKPCGPVGPMTLSTKQENK